MLRILASTQGLKQTDSVSSNYSKRKVTTLASLEQERKPFRSYWRSCLCSMSIAVTHRICDVFMSIGYLITVEKARVYLTLHLLFAHTLD